MGYALRRQGDSDCYIRWIAENPLVNKVRVSPDPEDRASRMFTELMGPSSFFQLYRDRTMSAISSSKSSESWEGSLRDRTLLINGMLYDFAEWFSTPAVFRCFVFGLDNAGNVVQKRCITIEKR